MVTDKVTSQTFKLILQFVCVCLIFFSVIKISQTYAWHS
jgi:hypothetical protein